jgi:serine/threonine protein kinase
VSETEKNRVGTAVSHYRIQECLGKGGMGVVYKALDIRLNRIVALKFLPESIAHDPEALARFEREARLASKLNHPNICTIHDIGEEDGSRYIDMEYLDGKSLKELMTPGAPLPFESIRTISSGVLNA